MLVLHAPAPDRMITALAFSARGTMLAAADQEEVRIWEPQTGRSLLLSPFAQGGWGPSVSFCGSGRRIAFARPGEVIVHNLQNTTCSFHRVDDSRVCPVLCFPPHGRTLFIAGRLLTALESQSGQTLLSWLLDGPSSAAAVSADNLLATGHGLEPAAWMNSGIFDSAVMTPEHWVTLHDVETQREVGRVGGLTRPVRSLAFSPDGTLLAIASGHFLYVCRSPSLRIVFDHRTAGQRCRAVAFSPDGRLLASAHGDEIILWDVAHWRRLGGYKWDIGPIRSLAFSRDGLRAAAGGTGRIVVWDLDT